MSLEDKLYPLVPVDDRINYLKGFAIAGVLILHIPLARLPPEAGVSVQKLSRWFDWCVLAFFFASGALRGYSTRELDWMEFTRRRASRLLVPFLSLSLTYALAYQVLQALVPLGIGHSQFPRSLGGKLYHILLCDDRMVGVQLYFLAFLFGISTIYEGAFLSAKRSLSSRLIWLGGVLVIISCLEARSPGSLRTFGPRAEVLVLGMIQYGLGFVVGRKEVSCTAIYWWTGLFTAVGFLWWWLSMSTFAINMVVPVMLWIAFTVLTTGFRIVPLSFLGKESASIYAYHTPFIFAGAMELSKLLFVRMTVSIIVATVITISLSVLTARFVAKMSWLAPFRL